jgi:hypothetical protein
MLPKDTRDQLATVEDRLRNLRAEKARLTKLFQAARSAAEETETDATLGAALAAKESVRQVDQQIEAEGERQVERLRRLGDSEAGRSGWAMPGVDGWHEAARKLNLATGDLRVDVAAASLLAPRASLPPARPADGTANLSPPSTSNRWLYPVFSAVPFGTNIGDLTATDFTVEFDQAALTGVEREPDATDPKAELPVTVALATPKAKQQAVVAENLPAVLFNNQDALRSFLSVEMGRRLSESFDASVVDAIESASPPNGSTGSDVVAKIRNAIADAPDLGCDPSVIALDPSTAASLDLEQDAGGYVFRVDAPRSEGAGSPVWSLRVREAPSVSAPLLVSPSQLGLVYYGEASVLVDPYHSMEKNIVRVRVEASAVMHVRNIGQGAYQIS